MKSMIKAEIIVTQTIRPKMNKSLSKGDSDGYDSQNESANNAIPNEL